MVKGKAIRKAKGVTGIQTVLTKTLLLMLKTAIRIPSNVQLTIIMKIFNLQSQERII